MALTRASQKRPPHCGDGVWGQRPLVRAGISGRLHGGPREAPAGLFNSFARQWTY